MPKEKKEKCLYGKKNSLNEIDAPSVLFVASPGMSVITVIGVADTARFIK